MKIIIQPFARKLRDSDNPNPKNYPYWVKLIEILEEQGHELIQIGVEGEQQLVGNMVKNASLKELKRLLEICDTWISVDSFLQHFGWSLGVKGIVLFGQSDPVIFGHEENINLYVDRKYFRPTIQQFWLWEQAEYIKEAFVLPEVVVRAISLFS